MSKKSSEYSAPMRARCILLLEDDTFFECRATEEMINELSLDWAAYKSMKETQRKIIADTLFDMERQFGGILHYVKKPINTVYPQYCSPDGTEKIDNMIQTTIEDT